MSRCGLFGQAWQVSLRQCLVCFVTPRYGFAGEEILVIEKKTMRVRIAVAISAEGKTWSSAGYSRDDGGAVRDSYLSDLANESCPHYPSVVHWVEADVPIPKSATVEGVVVESEEADD